MNVKTIGRRLGLLSLTRIDASQMSSDDLDDVADYTLENSKQRFDRIQAQLRSDNVVRTNVTTRKE
jgi:hypothetical protein